MPLEYRVFPILRICGAIELGNTRKRRVALERFSIQEFGGVKYRCFGCCEAFRTLSRHQTHPVILKSSDTTFPCARLVRGYGGQDKGIDVALAAGLDKYFPNPCGTFASSRSGSTARKVRTLSSAAEPEICNPRERANIVQVLMRASLCRICEVWQVIFLEA
jgi:hypothetical protein